MINILTIGDIVAKEGREIVKTHLPNLIKEHNIDCVIANIDNAAHGFGMNESIVREFLDIGVDVMTCGNHVFDQQEADHVLNKYSNVLRPLNYPKHTVGHGVHLLHKNGYQILIIHLMGQVFFPIHGDDPFSIIHNILSIYKMPKEVHAIIVDFHAETTAEKQAFGHYLDGKVSLVVGTHTHVPTNDLQILTNGTAYQTDLGMCGVYDSVIGMQKNNAIRRLVHKRTFGNKLEPATGLATLCGTFAQIRISDGLAQYVQPIIKNSCFNTGTKSI